MRGASKNEGCTDGWTDRPSYGDARTHLKRAMQFLLLMRLVSFTNERDTDVLCTKCITHNAKLKAERDKVRDVHGITAYVNQGGDDQKKTQTNEPVRPTA